MTISDTYTWASIQADMQTLPPPTPPPAPFTKGSKSAISKDEIMNTTKKQTQRL